ncbi:hypothetical protein Daus18300_011017 [Diaporthe australafricana]|uniref:Uncharacterized protein n=1 Tax=Diaporthe australafricana TaxID=127596 RepID=A0ABR3W8A9_9PEZI
MKAYQYTVLVAFVATLLPGAVFSAPFPASVKVKDSVQSGYSSYVGAVARDEFSTDGRSGYNSVDTTARDVITAAETGGRSGYNSVEASARDITTDAETDGRSGYNSIEVAGRDSTTNAETDGRSGYN